MPRSALQPHQSPREGPRIDAHPAQPVRIVCREDKVERRFAELVTHSLVVLLCEGPLPPVSGARALNHLLGKCGASIFATKAGASWYRKNFPRSLDGAPMLLPTEATILRRSPD